MLSKILTIILAITTFYKKLTTRLLIVGEGTRLYPMCCISTRYNKIGGVKIGANCRLGNFPSGYKIGWYRPTRISARDQDAWIIIGDESRISGVNIYARKLVRMGKHSEIGSGVIITDTNGHPTYSFNRTVGIDEPQSVEIGDNVWIGFNSVILKGTTIGDNCIVGAGSIVQGTFPRNAIIKGNPAKVVKIMDDERFQ